MRASYPCYDISDMEVRQETSRGGPKVMPSLPLIASGDMCAHILQGISAVLDRLHLNRNL
jgi:hypothetical protein